MFGLKIFVRVQIFRRVPPVLPRNFCHPVSEQFFPISFFNIISQIISQYCFPISFFKNISQYYEVTCSLSLRLISSFLPLTPRQLPSTGKKSKKPKIGFQFKIFANCICISSNKSCLCRLLQRSARPRTYFSEFNCTFGF